MLSIYPSLPAERRDIERVTRAAGNFHGDELTTPLELFDGYLRDPQSSGYYFLSAKRGEQVIGYACYGPTALTDGVFDLYWIVAEANAHGQGVGRALFDRVVEETSKQNGRLIVIWTESAATYDRARNFYERMGCKLESRIKDFYRSGGDLCIYVFRLRERSLIV